MKKLLSTRAGRLALMAGLGACAVLLAGPAMAQSGMTFRPGNTTIGGAAQNLTASIKNIGPLITAICYVGALVFGLVGAMKWKAYGEQPDRTPIKIPITYWGVAVLLAGFPEFMGTGITSLWGQSAQVVSEPM